jgi:hypothetical protein
MTKKTANKLDIANAAGEIDKLKKQAEDYLAKAQEALFNEDEPGDEALAHLDAALACINATYPADKDKQSRAA